MTINQRKGLILLNTEKTYATKKDRKEVLGPEKDIYLLFWGLKGNRTERRNPGRFGPIPVRSGRFGPNSGASRFGPIGAGRFGPVSKMGRFDPILEVSRFGLISLFWGKQFRY